jgi:glucose-6-phosphate isomerase
VTSAVRVTASRPLDDVVNRLVADHVASKIAGQDPTMWGPEAEAEASKRLSWVDLPETSRPLLAEIDALRADLRADGIDRVVLCGMGGSSLAPEVITSTFGAALEVLDSTNPSVVSRALGQDLSRTAVVVSSKSGGTLETDSQRRAFAAAFAEIGIDPATRMVVVTDPGSGLEDLAAEQNYRRIFLADPGVGGRYSALTAFGLVPSGLAGVEVAELLDAAAEAADAVRADAPDNPALQLAAALAGDPDRNKAVLADVDSGIVGFPDWAEQLLAESTGKNGRGILPVAVEGPDAPEARWPASDVVVAALTAADAEPGRLGLGQPLVAVTAALGAHFLTWETATAAAGRLLGINPFDQPDVESAKQAARGMLDEQPEPEPPAFVDSGIEVRASEGVLGDAKDVPAAVTALLSKIPGNGYLAVMAYLDRARDSGLRDARAALARRTERPTTFGWGPRFLHSTGQYHKGGPPEGVFLQITSTEVEDVPIPDRPFTFGQLIAAQAAGDAAVLADHGRPLLRLHLQNPAEGVPILQELLQ